MSGIERAGIERLDRGKAHLDAAQGHDGPHVAAWRRTGIVVRCQGYAQTGIDEILGAAVLHPEEERSPREHCGHGFLTLQSCYFRVSGALQMVHGKRIVTDSDLDAA